MSEQYVRNPKGIKKGKWSANDEDQEDFEQEKRIKEWLSETGAGEFEYKHIGRKGNARNTLIKASISLDQSVNDDSNSKFADLIAGSDGRDLECGPSVGESGDDPQEKISRYLLILGFKKEDLEWLKTILQLSIKENKLR